MNFSIMLILIASNIYSYTFTRDLNEGFYWRSFPIGMKKFVADPSKGALLNELTNRAVAQWEAAIGEDIWDVGVGFEVTQSFSGNFIRWSFNFEQETGYDGQTTLAVTTRYIQGTHVTRTEIILNGNNQILLANNDDLAVTILHEFGHTIGIGHSEEQAVMQASLGWNRNLTWDDEQAGIAAYEEHREKQLTGFFSPLAAEEFSDQDSLNFMGCGTISTHQGPPKSGLGAFLLMVMLSFFMFIRLKSIKQLITLLSSKSF